MTVVDPFPEGCVVRLKGGKMGTVQKRQKTRALVQVEGSGAEEWVDIVDLEGGEDAPIDNTQREDMIQLAYLNEPSVLNNLKLRYTIDQIYTYTGSILIAVNPFKDVTEALYGPFMMDLYRGRALGELSPHVYAIADAAYRDMQEFSRSHSILVSGESGAGKTETCKLLMGYLAYMIGQEENGMNGGVTPPEANGKKSLQDKVLESNPLLEAFGNAKTVRNDNSSRFGKFTEIQFRKKGAHKSPAKGGFADGLPSGGQWEISGAAIRTYLLERSRVVSVADPERNYHIFYQLCAGASEEERSALHLGPAASFQYLSRSSCLTLQGLDDAEEYARTRRAMGVVGIPEADQAACMRVLAAVLHLGNVAIESDQDGEGSKVAGTEEAQAALRACADLLGVEPAALEKSLTVRVRETRDGPIASPLIAAEAKNSRDSLAKKLYALLFDWLVGRINASMGHDPHATSVIGILDIYGFEEFKSNDFEQFCINYANEKLQQHFNKHVFKMEQQEYQREDIQWSYIDFVDNQDVLDLIERRPAVGKAALASAKEGPQVGILALLDEQCKFPRATHEDFALKLRSTGDVTASGRFKLPKMSQTAFTIEHYAGSVTYQTENFLEKNKDFVIADHESLLRSSSFAFLASLLEPPGEDGQPVRAAFKFSSVAGRFQVQLTELMETLSRMEPHYIRCIKPNDKNVANKFDPVNVVHQLRCGGVLEAVRISCAGYPSRMLYEEFMDRFWVLSPRAMGNGPGAARLFADHLLQLAQIPDYQLGASKVFLRSGHLATLEKRRAKRLHEAAVTIQAHMRGYHERLKFERVRRATALIQRVARGFLARQRVRALRRDRAAVTIQRMWRGSKARRTFERVRKAVLAIQAVYRGHVARKQVAALRRERAALKIQSAWRMHRCRRDFLEKRSAAIRIQSAWRALKARRLLKKLKREALQSTKLLEDNRSLQERVRDLREEKENVINQRNELKNQLQEARQQLKREREELRAEVERLEGALRESTAHNQALGGDLERERAQREADVSRLAAEVASFQGQLEELRGQLERQAAEHRAEVQRMQEEKGRLQGELLGRDQDLQRLQDERDRAAEKLVLAEASVEQLRKEAEALRQQAKAAPALKQVPSLRVSELAMPTAPAASPLGPAAAVPQSPHLRDPHPAVTPVRDTSLAPSTSTPTPPDASRMQRLTQAEQERERQLADLIGAGRLGFANGRPVAALAIFRCAVEWRAFQNTSTSFFDRVMECIQVQLHRHTEGGLEGVAAIEDLAYWLSVQANLLALIQRYTRASMQTQPGAGRALTGNFGPGSAAKLNIKGWAGAALAMFSGHGKHPALPAPEPEDQAGAVRFEAKYPCLLFKQQVDSNVTKIFSMLRENAKKAIAPLLASLMLQPKSAAGRQASVAVKPPPPGLSPSDPIAAMVLPPKSAWQELVGYFQELLTALQANHVPRVIVRRLFGQLALDINSQGFNQLVLRRECCSFSNGEYIKLGMAELENWLQGAGEAWVGEAFEELKHLRQAVNFLVIDKKPRKTYEEIKEDLCKDLTVQQIYRLSTMYWDQRYGTETVSKEVMDRMRMIMNAGGTNGTFILDSNSLVHASWDDLQQDAAGALQQMDIGRDLPPTLRARMTGENADLHDLAFLTTKFDPLTALGQQSAAPGTPAPAASSAGGSTPAPPGLQEGAAAGGPPPGLSGPGGAAVQGSGGAPHGGRGH